MIKNRINQKYYNMINIHDDDDYDDDDNNDVNIDDDNVDNDEMIDARILL